MRKTGDELITFNNEATGLHLRDFWSWCCSDLLDNTLRGTYAEFIVAAALGLDLSTGRINWEPWDLTLSSNQSDIHIEIKSCSYLQSWEQRRPSNIIFDIKQTKRWQPDGGYSEERCRQSDVYVFCLFAEKNAAKANPMEMGKWEFYVLSTKRLNEKCETQKTISLGSLVRLGAKKVDYAGLKDAVLQSV